MEAVRPFPESLAGGLAGLIPRRLWEPTGSGLPEQQPESERAEGRRLGHRSWSLPPATWAHPPTWETLELGRRALSAPEADAARCKLLV